MNLFYNFNKQEYFQREGLFVLQQLANVLDLQITTLNTRRSGKQTKKIKMAELEPAVFRRPSFVSGENLFQNLKSCLFQKILNTD